MKLDDVVIVRPGDKIPVDGAVVKGFSTVNQAAITGESIPVGKRKGDTVFAGTINEEGYLEIQVTKRPDETILSKIIEMVKESQKRKSGTESFIDRFAKYYTPTVIGLAIIVATLPPFLWGLDLDTWFYRGLVLLVVSCPCALIISIPVAMVSGITAGTKNGVLLKGGKYIEEMQNLDVMVFDKTGTLTKGDLEVTDIIPLKNYSAKEILEIACSLEMNSNHPLAKAVVKHAKQLNIEFKEVEDFESITGSGVMGKITIKPSTLVKRVYLRVMRSFQMKP